MSQYFGQHGKHEERKYTKHGATKQSYKDSCDINKLLERGAREGGLSHLERHGAMYGDFAAIDWDELPNKLAQGRQVFDELPAEIKREFNGSPGEFFAFVTDPTKADRLKELLPKIAERGNFFPKPNVVTRREEEPTPTEEPPAPTEEDPPSN